MTGHASSERRYSPRSLLANIIGNLVEHRWYAEVTNAVVRPARPEVFVNNKSNGTVNRLAYDSTAYALARGIGAWGVDKVHGRWWFEFSLNSGP